MYVYIYIMYICWDYHSIKPIWGPPHLPLAASKKHKVAVISLTKAPTKPTGSECISWRAHGILSVKAKLFGFEGPKSDLLMMNIHEWIQMSVRNSRWGNGPWLDLWIIIYLPLLASTVVNSWIWTRCGTSISRMPNSWPEHLRSQWYYWLTDIFAITICKELIIDGQEFKIQDSRGDTGDPWTPGLHK